MHQLAVLNHFAHRQSTDCKHHWQCQAPFSIITFGKCDIALRDNVTLNCFNWLGNFAWSPVGLGQLHSFWSMCKSRAHVVKCLYSSRLYAVCSTFCIWTQTLKIFLISHLQSCNSHHISDSPRHWYSTPHAHLLSALGACPYSSQCRWVSAGPWQFWTPGLVDISALSGPASRRGVK